jgi:hypothetical protein
MTRAVGVRGARSTHRPNRDGRRHPPDVVSCSIGMQAGVTAVNAVLGVAGATFGVRNHRSIAVRLMRCASVGAEASLEGRAERRSTRARQSPGSRRSRRIAHGAAQRLRLWRAFVAAYRPRRWARVQRRECSRTPGRGAGDAMLRRLLSVRWPGPACDGGWRPPTGFTLLARRPSPPRRTAVRGRPTRGARRDPG